MKPIESKRIALDRKIILRFPDFDGFVTEYATNLSITGMFVRSKEPPMAGTPVSFELRLEDGAPLVRGSGWVVWSRSKREASDRPAGMGIEFTQLDQSSRRLIRWVVLNQPPDGEKPFDVHTETASAPTTMRLVSQAAMRQRRRAGVLTAVVIFAALAGLVYWGGFRASGDANGSTAAPSVAEQTSKAADADHPARSLLEEPSSRATEAAAVASVESVVRSWAAAWSDQDADRYLLHYALDFVPEGGFSRSEWSDGRRQRLRAPRSIRVSVIRLETRLLSEVEAQASFLQTYRSGGYADTVDKVLMLARGEDGWKIRREITD